MVTMRRAKPTDAKAIAKILMVIFEQMGITEMLPEELVKRVARVFEGSAFLGEVAETIVAETAGQVVGVAFSYHADQEVAVIEHWDSAFIDTSLRLHPTSETLPGEWYLELLATDSKVRGQGVGGQLLTAVRRLAQDNGAETLALNVDVANPKAERLYRRQGYQSAGDMTILGHRYHHLELNLAE